jgi:hypothetical protein
MPLWCELIYNRGSLRSTRRTLARSGAQALTIPAGERSAALPFEAAGVLRRSVLKAGMLIGASAVLMANVRAADRFSRRCGNLLKTSGKDRICP